MALVETTATTPAALITQIRIAATSNGWTLSTGIAGTTILTNTTSGISVYLTAETASGNSGIGIQMSDAWSTTSGTTLANQTTVIPKVYLRTHPTYSYACWIYVNNKRIVCVTRTENLWYNAFYVGRIIPYGTSTTYAKPYCVIGTHATLGSFYDGTNYSYGSLISPGSGAVAYIRGKYSPTRTYNIRNRNNTTRQNIAYSSSSQDTFLFPTRTINTSTVSTSGWWEDILPNALPYANGHHFGYNIYIYSISEKTILGRLDGVIGTPPRGASSESNTTFEGNTYRIFSTRAEITGGDSYFGIADTD